MNKQILFLFFVFVSVTTTSAGQLYNHNGSLMRLEKTGDAVSIYYDKPRKGLRSVGVQSGTLLFEGRMDGKDYVAGLSRIFSKRCGEIDYYVYGDFRSGQAFTLRGAAPVLGKNNCRIVDNVYEGSNANLVFTPVSRQPQTSNKNPANFRRSLACITNVKSGDTLNMRSGPSTDYGIVSQIPAGKCNVRVGETCIGNWCGVRHEANVGWVHTNFLKRR